MSKKKKKSKIPKSMRKKFREHKRVKKAIDESRERLLQRTKAQSADAKMEFRIAPPTKEKMSEIIIDFARPLLDVASNVAAQKTALTIAIVIWNLSLLPEDMQSEHKKEIEKNMSLSDETDDLSNLGQEVFNYLMKRKKLFFSDINRMVVDYEFVETPEGFNLNVVSNILKNQMNSKNVLK